MRFFYNTAHRGFITAIPEESQVVLEIHMKVLPKLPCAKQMKRLELAQNISIR